MVLYRLCAVRVVKGSEDYVKWYLKWGGLDVEAYGRVQEHPSSHNNVM